MADTWELMLLALVALAALSGWVLAEFDNRRLEVERDLLQNDLDVALGWQERQMQERAVVHTTLHLVEGGDA
jgi:hypothetical protein